MSKRVVVTGLGIISCIGKDIDTFWGNLQNGVCGIDYIDEFDTTLLPVHIGGQIKDFNPLEHGMDKAFVRKQDMFSQFAMAAANGAVADSGLVAGQNIDAERFGVYVSSGVGGFLTINKEFEGFREEPSGRFVSPAFIPSIISNMAAGNVAIKFGAQGPCIDIVTACASSTHAIGEAFHSIKHGYADAIIAGGTEKAIFPMAIAGFASARALTKEADPKHACLPFNANRGGFVMSDGGAAIILEEYEHAVARGAKIYAEIVGYGSTCDAYHNTAPRPDGTTQARCISLALQEAGYNEAEDKVYVNAHGTGTLLNDRTETAAYKIAFGQKASEIKISSTKSMHGHMLGATGAAEAIATVLALRDGIIPPTINLDAPDPECDLDYTPNTAVKADVNLGISDSFGFGGHNACIAFRKI